MMPATSRPSHRGHGVGAPNLAPSIEAIAAVVAVSLLLALSAAFALSAHGRRGGATQGPGP